MANRRFIDFPIATTVGDSDIILIWQSGVNKQTTKATFLSGLPENLEDLNDVVISGLTNGQILRYDSVTGKWENTDQGNLDLNDLNDVSIVSPSNGQVLVYNSSTSKWENSSGGFVPYVGAVTTVDLGAQGLRAGYVRFDTSVASVPNEQGLMYWDASRSTAALIMNGTLQHIGQDTFFYVKNSSGSTIPKGTCVRFAGTDGASGHLLIVPFLANGSVPSSHFLGVTAEAITNGSFGQVMHFGELEGINTSSFTAGALLYASTTVAGGFQTTVPVAPNNIVLVAAAVNSKNNGAIVVRPTYGSNINIDEGVKITSPTTGDLLQLQAGGLWENKTLAQVIGSAYVPSTRTITINGTTQDLSANRTYNVGTVTSVAALTLGTSGTDLSSSVANGTTTPVITLNVPTASATNRGALSAADWSTFNAKQNALTLTTTGTSGAATLVGSTLNIPIYSPDLSGYVPTSRTITINGVTQDLSANRTFNVGTVTSVGLSSATSGVTIGSTPVTSSGTITLAIATASGSQQGLLSAADWTTFNNKQNALTNPVTGTGTTNYLPKFTGSTMIGNSQIFDNGTNVGIGTASPTSYTGFINTSIGGSLRGLLSIRNNANNEIGFLYNSGGNVFTLESLLDNLQLTSPASTLFVNGGSTRMTLNSSGNLGLGVTPSAWNSSVKVIEIANTGNFIGNSGQDNWLATNTIYDSGATFRYARTGSAVAFYSQSSGGHFWFNAPIGTAGNAISLNQAMTLNLNGNLLVGTTSDNGARLQVSGSIHLLNGGNRNIRIGSATNYYYDLQSTNDDFQIIEAGSTPRLTIKYPNGNVGIGTSSPTTLLQVEGSAPIFTMNRTSGGFINRINFSFVGTNYASIISDAGAGEQRYSIGPSAGWGGYHTFYTDTTERMRINSNGGVLLTSDAGNEQFIIRRASNTNAQLVFGYHSDGYGRIQAVEQNVAFRNLLLNQSGGNVLIGTTTDVGARLHVNGDVRTAAPTGGSAVNWRLGTVRGGTVTPNATVRVEIGGVLVDLDARYV